MPSPIEHFHHGIAERHRAAPIIVRIGTRPPRRLFVGEHRQADDRLLVAIDRAGVVGEHAAREVLLEAPLHVHMDQHPLLRAVVAPHARQHIHRPPSLAPLSRDRLEFLVEEGDGP